MSDETTNGELVAAIVRSIVNNPGKVEVKEVIGDKSILIEVFVLKSDMGAALGKKGAHADAIRTLLLAIAGKEKKSISMTIYELKLAS